MAPTARLAHGRPGWPCPHGFVAEFRKECIPCLHPDIAGGVWLALVQEPHMRGPETHVVLVEGGAAHGFGHDQAYSACTLTFLRRIEIPEFEVIE